MKGKTLTIVAAPFCAGLVVTLVPDIAPDVATGLVEDSGLVAPNIVTIDKFAAKSAPTTARVRRVAEGRRHKGNRDGKIVRVQDWPYCDPACLRGRRQADDAHVVLTGNESAVKNTLTTTTSINRTHKSDRLLQDSLVKPNSSLSPSAQIAPASAKRPFGCDPAFSPVTDPAHAHIYKGCMT